MNLASQQVTKRLPGKSSDKSQDLCSVIATLRLFAPKWKPCILCHLSEGTLRYTELYKIIPNISRKMLSEHLDELEADGLVARDQRDEKLQRVEYRLSDKGRSLIPLLEHLQDWGMANLENVQSIKEMVAHTR